MYIIKSMTKRHCRSYFKILRDVFITCEQRARVPLWLGVIVHDYNAHILLAIQQHA